MGELRQELLVWMGKKRVTKRQMQSLAGKLNWATQCVYGGRYHLRRLLDAMNSLKKPWHNLKMNRDMKADIEWWLEYMCEFNGVNDMVSCRPATPISIAASQVAAGGVHGSAFFSLPWSQWEGTSDKHINFKEVLALEATVFLWAEHWRNKKVFVHSDNKAAVGIINKGSCRDTTVMASLRRVFWASAVYNFRLKAVYYPGGERNVLADAASRLHQPGMFDFLFGKILLFQPVDFISDRPTAGGTGQLGQEVESYRAQTYAPTTSRSYASHRRVYLAFCSVMGYAPIPADSRTLCQYAALLARTLRYNSFRQYLNVIRSLHLEWGSRTPWRGVSA